MIYLAVIATMNMAFDKWLTVVGDAKMTTDLLGRLTHHGLFIERRNEPRLFENSA